MKTYLIYYFIRLGGLLMGFENIKMIKSGCWICDENSFVRLLIHGVFYIFAPEPGSSLLGE